MFKQPKNRILLCRVLFAAGVFLTTCGLEEYYYLPQVPQTNIGTEFNTSATINLPPLTGYYYAQNYIIFYRIYISGNFESGTIDSSLRSTISPTLASDFSIIEPNTDPTSSTAGTPANTLFKGRYYYELALEGEEISDILSINGGRIKISFPTVQGGIPVLSINDGSEINLLRSNELTSSSEPKDDKYFRNTFGLNNPDNAVSNINPDVAGRTGLSQRYAYVSMYIVAKGTNQYFSPVYSKPTHISIFRLPEN